ncbi:MAG: T9SS type A sorting domain-containing protein [Bacteroidota bacterium]
MRGFLLGILLGTIISRPVQAQNTVIPVSYSGAGSVYSQTFDGLPATGSFSLTGKGPFNLSASPISGTNLTGWQILMVGGSNPHAAFLPGTGSGTGNGVYSLGNAGSGERALGSLASSTGIYAMGLILTNTSGALLNSFTLGFTAEQWRKGGSTNKNTWAFRYKTGTLTQIDVADLVAEPNLNFSSVITTSGAGSINGNLPENQQSVSFTVTGITWKNGEQLLLRWDDADESGSDDVMALDNIRFSAILQTGLPVISNTRITDITAESAILSAMVNDSFANTSLLIEYDSVPGFSHPQSLLPAPASLLAGSGNSSISANISSLVSGKTYYTRVKAINSNGTVTGPVQNFITAIALPIVKTLSASQITRNSAVIAAELVSEGGAVVTEKGIAWSLAATPSLINKKISTTTAIGNFAETISGLPPGAIFFAKAYAINSGGIVYGDSIRFATPTVITSFVRSAPAKTNIDTVAFSLQTEQPVQGLASTHFYVVSAGISNAVITGITGSANNYTINIATGTGDGKLGLQLVNDSDLSVPISTLPITALGEYLVDKSPPQIRQLAIPDKAMKIGDTIQASILLVADTETLKLKTGVVNGFALNGFLKQHDSLYTAWFVISNGGNDVKADSAIPVNIVITDSLGNSHIYQDPVIQKADAIDANKPAILSIKNPAANMYIAGDSLYFIFHFTETVIVTGGIPSLTLTIGTRSRSAIYINGSGSDSLVFRYIVSTGDLDTDGIKTAGTITMNNAAIRDSAGNAAAVGFTNTNGTKNVLMDGAVPLVTQVGVPVATEYKTGNVLDFMVGYSRKVWIQPGDSIPYLVVVIGNKTKPAYYVNGSGSNTILFRYIVQKDDSDTDGIKLNSVLFDVGKSIRDSVGNHASLLLASIGNMTGVRINIPTIVITGVTVPAIGNYKTGDSLLLQINYNEKVFVTNGSPSIKLTIGTTGKQAVYQRGSGTNTLVFGYVVQTGDKGKNGIKVNPAILLNNGTIKDEKENDAPVLFAFTDTSSGIIVDAVAPVFMNPLTEKIIICENGPSISFSGLLAITDDESGESVQWKIQNNPKLGAVSLTEYSIQSTGKKITPTGFTYQPFFNRSGTDSIFVEVSDGINTNGKTIIIAVQPAVKNNFISGSQVICMEQTASIFRGEIPTGGDGLYQYSWDISSDSSRYSLANGTSHLPQYMPSLLQNNSWFRRRVVSGACSDTSSPLKIMVVKNGIWLGNKNSSWNDAGNWCMNQLPVSTTDVRINANSLYQPIVLDTARCNRLLLATDAHLGITGVLQLYGEITGDNNSIRAEKGTLFFSGTQKQYLNGNLFEGKTIQNLFANNGSGISLINELTLSGKLLLSGGSFETNDRLFLTNNATVAAAAAGSKLIGKVTVEHVLEGGKRNFHLIGNPFAESIALQMMKDSLDITGNNGNQNGFTGTATNPPSAFHLDPVLGNDSTGIDAGWTSFTHTNGLNENAWLSNEGIRLLVRGRPGQGLDDTPAGDGKNGTYLPLPVTLRLSGNLQYGDREFVLQKDAYAGYYAVSNPYISGIDLSRVTRASNLSRYYWLWNPRQGRLGGYTAYPFRTKQILPPFHTFITRMNANGSGSILFTENSKSDEPATDSITRVVLDDLSYVELRLESDSIFWDRVVVFAMDSARNYYDRNDAEKLINSEVNFYSIAAGQKKLSIDARPLSNESFVPLGIQSNVQGAFVIRVTKALLSSSNTLMLHDKLYDSWTKLEADSFYRFDISQDTTTSGDQRFEITSRKKTEIPIAEKYSVVLILSPVPAKDKLMVQFSALEKGNTSVRLLTITGNPVKTMQLGIQQSGQTTMSLDGIAPGIYLVELRCGNQFITKKIIKD